MAYQALYRQWRPQTFSDVVGQKHVSTTLQRALEQGRLAHAYLFSGPRGTGKTSMARILAKAVNCEHPHDGNPCNECRNCLEISSGSSLDVYEIDAASNRGIEEIRALKESVRTLPSACRKKVYIIDEVHMLSNEAFNALLKTLEEPPSYVLFILATTEPGKIPLTILSRCQTYDFRRISTEDISDHLMYIAGQAKFPLTEEAADLIAVRSDGGLRDALSLLDQCVSSCEGSTLDAESVQDLLGLTGKEQLISLSRHIFKGESGEALSVFYDILQRGREPASILRDLLEHFRNLMVCRIDPDTPELLAYGRLSDEIKKDAESLSEPYLDALFEALHESLQDLKWNTFPKMSAEMGILRLCRVKGSRAADSLAERVSQLEKEVESLKKIISLKNAFPAPSSASAPAPAAPLEPSFGPPPEIPPFSPPSAEEKPAEIIMPKAKPAMPASTPKETKKLGSTAKKKSSSIEPAASTPAANAPSSLIDPASYSGIWEKVLSYFKAIHRVEIYTCYRKGTLIYANNARAVITAPQQFLVIMGNNKSYQTIAAEAFQKIVGSPILLHVVLEGSGEEAETKALLAKEMESSAAPTPSGKEEPAKNEGGYKLVSKDEIAQSDLEDPSFKEALKMLPDYDIYEKD